MLINAGQLRHRVVIQARTLSDTAGGGQTESWSTHATVWARVEPVSGRELMEAQQLEARVSHKVTIRALDTVTSEMRISHGSRSLNIESVLRINNELGEAMMLMCSEAA